MIYRIQTSAAAMVDKTWTLHSTEPLTADEIIELMHDGAVNPDPRVVSLNCTDEETYDEHDRIVVTVTDEHGCDVPSGEVQS